MLILVTGGAGFVGSHLVDYLLALDPNNHVLCVDNFFTGERGNLKPHPRLEVIEHDVVLPFPSSITSRKDEIKQVYHLACPASPVHYQKDPLQTFLTCTHGVENLLHLFCLDKEKNAKNPTRVLITSTSEVYGDPAIHPQVEEYFGNVNMHGPRSCYDEGKRAAETLFHIAKSSYNADVTVARLFNTYGPRMCLEDGRVVSNFIVQAIKKQPLTIYGTGLQTRSFCYVSDTVKAIVALMETPLYYGPINIGNPDENTIVGIAEKIYNLVNKDNGTTGPPNITHVQIGADDPTKRKPDITKAKAILHWEPTVTLDVGLSLILDDFKQRVVV
jgi:UDP-glucuronate decarboxylase